MYCSSLFLKDSSAIHNIADGILLYKIDVWNWLPWKVSYRLLDVSDESYSLIAFLDPSNHVYIFDLACAISLLDNLKFNDSQRFVLIIIHFLL